MAELTEGWFRGHLSKVEHYFKQTRGTALCGAAWHSFTAQYRNKMQATPYNPCKLCTRLLEYGTLGDHAKLDAHASEINAEAADSLTYQAKEGQ